MRPGYFKVWKEDPMRALGLLLGFLVLALAMPASAQYPEVTIQDIQFVENPDSSDFSPLEGDTLVVEGVAMGHARSLWGGARWSLMIADPDGGPWSGLQVIQHDTSQAGTNFTAVQEGYMVKFTGLVEEFSYVDDRKATQFALLTNPPVPIQITGVADIPEPEVVTCEDLSFMATGEQWEEVLVKIEGAVMINNDLGSGQALFEDETGYQIIIEDWYNSLKDSLYDGLYEWPPNGSRFDITGFVRDLPSGTDYAVAPRSSGDLHLHTLAPIIENIVWDPVVPGSTDEVTIGAEIYDLDGQIMTQNLYYSVGEDPFSEVAMVLVEDTTYTAAIPAQEHGSIVRFFIKAIDNEGNEIVVPDTSLSFMMYHVLDEGFGIYHVQWTPYGDGGYESNSVYEDLTVTVTGTVMNDTLPFAGSYYFIQDSDEPWHGILIDDSFTLPNPGDEVRVTGIVDEWYSLTRIVPDDPSTDVEILSTGLPVFDPIMVPTGDIATSAGLGAESYEGMLVRVEDVIVSTPFPDAPSNHGEFAIDDGSGEVRVDDISVVFNGNNDSTYTQDMPLNFLQGFLWYSYSDFKIQPRGYDDIEGLAGERSQVRPVSLTLLPPRPNPGIGQFTLVYILPNAAAVNLAVFDLAGHRVRSLISGPELAGRHTVIWNTKDDRGRLVPVGTYVCRLKAGSATRNERLVVLR